MITRSSWGLQIPLPTAPCFVLFPSSCLPKLLFSIKKQRKTRVHIGMKQHAAILRGSGKMNIWRISRFRLNQPHLFWPKTNIYEKLWVIDDGFCPNVHRPIAWLLTLLSWVFFSRQDYTLRRLRTAGGQGKMEKSREDLDQKHMFKDLPPPPVK